MRLADIGSSNRTFASLGTIADTAMLPVGTVKRHVGKLIDAGWLDTRGRELLRGSAYLRRRTNTLTLTAKTIEQRKPYGILPRWFCLVNTQWARRVLYAAIVSRHILIETVAERECGEAYGREEMSLRQLMTETGLTHKSIVAAKRSLATGRPQFRYIPHRPRRWLHGLHRLKPRCRYLVGRLARPPVS